jgi:hypothetical protein
MVEQFLWSLSLVLALVLVGVAMRVISLRGALPQPVPVEIQPSALRGSRQR